MTGKSFLFEGSEGDPRSPLTRSDLNHGTTVLGILMGDHNEKGCQRNLSSRGNWNANDTVTVDDLLVAIGSARDGCPAD